MAWLGGKVSGRLEGRPSAALRSKIGGTPFEFAIQATFGEKIDSRMNTATFQAFLALSKKGKKWPSNIGKNRLLRNVKRKL